MPGERFDYCVQPGTTGDLCICGHRRSKHTYCSEEYPALCTYVNVGVAMRSDDPYAGVCCCLGFEADGERVVS